MGYDGFHETTNLCPPAFTEREGATGGRSALQRRLRPASLPDSVSECSRRTPTTDSPLFGLRVADGAQRHPRVQPERSQSPHTWLLKTQAHPRRFRRGECRCSQGTPAPLSEEVDK